MTIQLDRVNNAIALVSKVSPHIDVISTCCVNFSICAGAFGLFIYNVSTSTIFVYSIAGLFLSQKLSKMGHFIFFLILANVMQCLRNYKESLNQVT